MPARQAHVVLSCEHATNALSPRWRRQLARCLSEAELAQLDADLATHAAVDFGALPLARDLGRALGVEVHATGHTRLLVDCNRSAHHPRRLSRYSRALGPDARARLLAEAYRPHRGRVAAAVNACVAAHGRALHLALHSFTPTWQGVARTVDLGVLYDPARAPEAAFGRRLAAALRAGVHLPRGGGSAAPVVRRNAPYRGAADGLPTALRRQHAARTYLGIELEVTQAWPLGDAAAWRILRRALVDVLVRQLRENF